ncbi:MAG: hypothetical protein GY696_05310 [Gammaproteobacteria bacterium]|nr:hypothetical protein [Gammaproteobacteria bacterium]
MLYSETSSDDEKGEEEVSNRTKKKRKGGYLNVAGKQLRRRNVKEKTDRAHEGQDQGDCVFPESDKEKTDHAHKGQDQGNCVFSESEAVLCQSPADIAREVALNVHISSASGVIQDERSLKALGMQNSKKRGPRPVRNPAIPRQPLPSLGEVKRNAKRQTDLISTTDMIERRNKERDSAEENPVENAPSVPFPAHQIRQLFDMLTVMYKNHVILTSDVRTMLHTYRELIGILNCNKNATEVVNQNVRTLRKFVRSSERSVKTKMVQLFHKSDNLGPVSFLTPEEVSRSSFKTPTKDSATTTFQTKVLEMIHQNQDTFPAVIPLMACQERQSSFSSGKTDPNNEKTGKKGAGRGKSHSTQNRDTQQSQHSGSNGSVGYSGRRSSNAGGSNGAAGGDGDGEGDGDKKKPNGEPGGSKVFDEEVDADNEGEEDSENTGEKNGGCQDLLERLKDKKGNPSLPVAIVKPVPRPPTQAAVSDDDDMDDFVADIDLESNIYSDIGNLISRLSEELSNSSEDVPVWSHSSDESEYVPAAPCSGSPTYSPPRTRNRTRLTETECQPRNPSSLISEEHQETVKPEDVEESSSSSSEDSAEPENPDSTSTETVSLTTSSSEECVREELASLRRTREDRQMKLSLEEGRLHKAKAEAEREDARNKAEFLREEARMKAELLEMQQNEAKRVEGEMTAAEKDAELEEGPKAAEKEAEPLKKVVNEDEVKLVEETDNAEFERIDLFHKVMQPKSEKGEAEVLEEDAKTAEDQVAKTSLAGAVTNDRNEHCQVSDFPRKKHKKTKVVEGGDKEAKKKAKEERAIGMAKKRKALLDQQIVGYREEIAGLNSQIQDVCDEAKGYPPVSLLEPYHLPVPVYTPSDGSAASEQASSSPYAFTEDETLPNKTYGQPTNLLSQMPQSLPVKLNIKEKVDWPPSSPVPPGTLKVLAEGVFLYPREETASSLSSVKTRLRQCSKDHESVLALSRTPKIEEGSTPRHITRGEIDKQELQRISAATRLHPKQLIRQYLTPSHPPLGNDSEWTSLKRAFKSAKSGNELKPCPKDYATVKVFKSSYHELPLEFGCLSKAHDGRNINHLYYLSSARIQFCIQELHGAGSKQAGSSNNIAVDTFKQLMDSKWKEGLEPMKVFLLPDLTIKLPPLSSTDKTWAGVLSGCGRFLMEVCLMLYFTMHELLRSSLFSVCPCCICLCQHCRFQRRIDS